MGRSVRWSSWWLIAVALAGCGPARNPGSFQGTVNGLTLDVKDSLFFVHPDRSGEPLLWLLMVDRPGLCEAMKTGHLLPKMNYFQAAMGETSSDPSALPTPGDFTAVYGSSSPSRYAAPSMNSTDEICSRGLPTFAAGGTVTVGDYKAQAGGSMTGTFDLTFAAGEQATGDFDAGFCDISPVVGGCQ
ncbi:MAG TPA: hypothetical protein VFA20_15330 [Myxococcaceae bacterium]|nr:hypothetical protein [Myxococcaceae bacterium]